MQLMAAIFYPFVGLINQAKTSSHSQANKLYGNPRKVLKFTYCQKAENSTPKPVPESQHLYHTANAFAAAAEVSSWCSESSTTPSSLCSTAEIETLEFFLALGRYLYDVCIRRGAGIPKKMK